MRKNKILALALSALTLTGGVMGFAGCGDDNPGGSLGDDGIYRPEPGAGPTKITFWGYGEDYEISVFQSLVDDFNELYKDSIEVKYEPQISGDYNQSVTTALSSSRARVDVLYIGDADFKRYATLGMIEPLDRYLEISANKENTQNKIDIDEMWATSVNRFKYDVNTTTQEGPDSHYYGIPKDIGPTVIYYNETHFKQAGVNVISVAAEDLDAFNNDGAPDSRGKTKAEYGITGEVKEKGYFVDGANKWFNNQVPMSWDECVTLANLVQTAGGVDGNGLPNHYGYFTEWWFNYGWSVGGDCIEYIPTDDPTYNGGYWEFTLMDPTKNYIVADDAADFTINGNTYKAGEIVTWNDKLANCATDQETIAPAVLAAAQSGQLNELPSQREAFVEFVRIGQKTNVEVDDGLMGYGICPNPTSIGGDAGKTAAFATGKLSMLVDGRWNVVQFRERMDDVYEWDVAPLPQYKEYDNEGNITVHGVEAGHSGSVALCINANSKNKDAAWAFCEYIGGKTGQEAQAASGFAIPSQIDSANSEVFLQSDQNPRNSMAFVRAAEYETPGDWWYLYDKEWTGAGNGGWADVLNGQVRKGELTLSQFETHEKYLDTWRILLEYTKKNKNS